MTRLSPSRRRDTSAQTTSTPSPLESRSPTTPAKPRRADRAPGGRARAARAEVGSSACSTRTRYVVVRAQHGAVRRVALAQCLQLDARLHRAVPAVQLQLDGGVVALVAGGGGQRRRRGAEHDPSARRPPLVSVKQACCPSSPIAANVADLRGRHEQRGLGVAVTERAQALQLLRQLEPERAAGHEGVDPLLRHEVVRDEHRGGMATIARRKASIRDASISNPAAARWPPKRVRCSEQAARPACRS